jgi:hypothetical protein
VSYLPANLLRSCRVFSVVWLLVWLTAQTLCVYHCASVAVSAEEEAGCCAKKSSAHSTSDPDSGMTDCGGLKTVMLQTNASLSQIALAVSEVSLVSAFALPEPRPNEILLGSFRGVPRVDWVFEPEISLGAALRAHAPPAQV